MPLYSPPPVEPVQASLALGDRVIDLAARALVVAAVPSPRWARESEVVAGVHAAGDAGADVAEVPADPRLLGPAAQAGKLPVATRVTTAAGARAARAAGATLLLVPLTNLEVVTTSTPGGDGPRRSDAEPRGPLAVLVRDPRQVGVARDGAGSAGGELPVALDAIHLAGVDLVAELSLGLSAGARIVRTGDVRRVRRVVEVMTALLESRR